MKPAYWFIFHNEQLLLTTSSTSPLVTETIITTLKYRLTYSHLLGYFDHFTAYCAELQNDDDLPADLKPTPLRHALDLIGSDWYNIAVKAYTIINWDKNHQFCGRCGSITTQKSQAFERICTVCSQIFYPRISPSVIGLIKKDDQILMARSPHFTPGAYGLIAGFVEGGESAEEALHREVFEEVGIKIKNLTYFGSQAWPFPDSLMIAFTAEYASGDIIIDTKEIEAAGWYDVNHLPGRPSTRISLSSKLLDHFIAQVKV